MNLVQRIVAYFKKEGPLNRILLNTGYLFSSNTASMFISAVQSILVARLIGVLGVGLVANITRFTTNTSQLLSFRMGELVVTYFGQYLEQGEKKKASAVLRWAAILEALTSVFKFVVVVALAPVVARYLVRRPELTPLFIYYGYSVFANLTSQTSTAALQVFKRFDVLAILNLVQNVLSFVVVGLAFFTGGDIVDVVTAYLTAKAFNGISLMVFSLRFARQELGRGWWRVPWDKSISTRTFWKFAFSSNLSATVRLVAQDSEELWITYFLSPLAAGYYNTAMKVIAMILLPINPFIQPTFLEITTQAAKRQWARLKELLRKTSMIAGAWTAAVTIVLLILGWWLIPFVYGEEFAPATAAALILLIGFGTANTLYWNRPLVLALEKTDLPLGGLDCRNGGQDRAGLCVDPSLRLSDAGGFAVCLPGVYRWDECLGRIAGRAPTGTVGYGNGYRNGYGGAGRMRICCIAPSRIPSSTANSIQAMKACNALARLGHEVVLIAPGSGPEGESEEEKWALLAEQYGIDAPFEFDFIPPFDGYWARRVFPWRAIWQARHHQPDVIYSWLTQSAIGGLLGAWPVVVEMHDVPIGRFAGLWYWLFLAVPGRKRQMVITQTLKDRLAADYKPAQPETFIAPNGVDLKRYVDLPAPAQARQQLGLPEMPTVTCTGSLYAGRGAELVMQLAQRMPEVHFLWAGGRPKELDERRAAAEELALENMTFAGFVPNAELPLYQAASDILLMPYQERIDGSSGSAPVEFFSSMKMYEYMASNRPIISSDLPVIYEVLEKDAAVFVPPADLDAWEAAIRQLLAHPDRAAELAAKAFELVQPFTWTARARQVLEGWGD